MDISKLTERGVRDLLTSIRETRTPLTVRLRAAEQEAALQQSAAESLRKISGFLDMFETLLRTRLAELERKL